MPASEVVADLLARAARAAEAECRAPSLAAAPWTGEACPALLGLVAAWVGQTPARAAVQQARWKPGKIVCRHEQCKLRFCTSTHDRDRRRNNWAPFEGVYAAILDLLNSSKFI